MTRNQAHELLAFWLYLDRKHNNLLEYGNAENDWRQAEKILRHFDGDVETYGIEYKQDMEDFERFRPIYQLMGETEDVELE